MSLNGRNVRFFILLFLWLVVLFFMRPWDKLKGNIFIRQDAKECSHEIYGSISITQTFVVDEVFDSIDIYMENYNNTYEGDCKARIIDASSACIHEQIIEKSELFQGWFELRLPQKIYADGERYTLELTAPNLDENNCVILYSSNEQAYENGIMSLNGDTVDGTLCFSVYEVRKNIFAYLAIFIFAISAVIWWINRKKSIMKISIIVLTGMGLCMLVMFTPMSAPDDQYHYNSALILSNIIMGQENVYEVLDDYQDLTGIVGHNNANSAFVRVYDEFFSKKASEASSNYYNLLSSNKLYHPIIYLAPALGITVGRIIGVGFIPLYYFGRIFNLLVYIFLSLLAIKVAPKYKEFILMVAALPMCLHQAVSYSYDVVINGMSFVFVAYTFQLIYREDGVTWKDALVLVAIGGILCPGKLVYIVLLGFLFIIPKEKFKDLKDRKRKLGLILFGVILIFAVTQFQVVLELIKNSKDAAEAAQTSSIATQKYTGWFIVQYPEKFIQIVYNTIISFMMEWIRNGIGKTLAGLSLPIDEYLICGFAILMVMSCFRNGKDTFSLNVRQKRVCWLLVVSGVFLVLLAIFTDTNYGNTLIAGVQGRYFIPFIIPIILAMRSDKITVNVDNNKLFCVYWFLQAGVMNCILSNVVY